MRDEVGQAGQAAACPVPVAGRRLQAMSLCSTGSGPSTGCRSPRRPLRCAGRSCMPHWSSSTACPREQRGPQTVDAAGRPGLGAGDRRRTRAGRAVGCRAADAPAGRGPQAAVGLLPPGRPDPLRPSELRATHRGRAGRRHPAARNHRPHRRRAHRRVAGGRLQDRQGPAGGPRAGRVQGDVPDEVLCGRVVALPRCAADAAAADLPLRRPAAGLLPRRSRAAALREDADGDLARDSIRRCHRRFPATAVAAVRLVRTPRALSGLRRHPPPYPGWPQIPDEGNADTVLQHEAEPAA